MSKEHISQEFQIKNIDKTRNYLTKEINQNELMSRKHKKVCKGFNYIDYLFIVISTTTSCVSIFAFVSLVGIQIGITSSAIRLKICARTAGIIQYNSTIKKSKRSTIK